MTFADAFTVLRSTALTVRVEPPDLVIVEGLSAGTLRFTRSRVRMCSPMLVSWYREHYHPAFVAPDDGEIVVRLHIEGVYEGLLGPFPHADGMALANAINTACTNLLFAAPNFSVHVAADDARLLVDCVWNGMRLTIPVPTAGLADCVVRDDARLDARYAIPTGLTPSHAARWLAFMFAHDKPYLLGPLSARDAATLAAAFQSWRAATPLDAEPVDVSERDLVADPARWHLRRIRVTGEWRFMFEYSAFATAWLHAPEGFPCAYGTHRVRVVGTWVYPGTSSGGGHGHMGMWPGNLEAETIELFDD